MLGVDRWGSYAEHVVLPAQATVLLPPGLPFDQATVLVRHAPTALHQLEDRAQVKAGEWVLVMGAAGGLGSCLVQVAKLNNARVIAGAGSDERVQQCLANGADYGVNYRACNLAAEVARITDGHGADVVCENIADPTLWPGAFGSIAHGGRLVTAGAHGGGKVELDVQRLYLRRLTLIGDPGNSRQNLVRTMQLAAAGKLRAVIGRTLPLEDAAGAHRLVMESSAPGKVLLIPPQSPPRVAGSAAPTGAIAKACQL
jgi:NADPH:quinone reductase-like Zn-dependent oxidoreductase